MESKASKKEEQKAIDINAISNNNQKENLISTNSNNKDNQNEKKYDNIIKKVYQNFTYVGQMEKIK